MDSLGDLAAWLASATAYVGNDSGITHLAAAVGTPVVALFGTTDPAVWCPRGENVVCMRKREDLPAISVDEAVGAIRQIIRRDRRPLTV